MVDQGIKLQFQPCVRGHVRLQIKYYWVTDVCLEQLRAIIAGYVVPIDKLVASMHTLES